MWNTSDGLRTLTGMEAQLIRDTAGELVDAIRAEKDYGEPVELGIPTFDQLSWQQKMVMLLHVLKPLLIEAVPSPPRSALNDATVAAIYAQMETGVESEIYFQQTTAQSEEGDTDRRRQIIEAIEEHGSELNWPDPECVVMDEWELAIAEVKSWVLPDEDYQMDGLTLDAPPEKSHELKRIMGISQDYFTTVPPDSTDNQARTAWADIQELIGDQRPDENVF
jgi:hypothetical protein